MIQQQQQQQPPQAQLVNTVIPTPVAQAPQNTIGVHPQHHQHQQAQPALNQTIQPNLAPAPQPQPQAIFQQPNMYQANLMQQPQQPAPYMKRERKPLTIVDPATKQAVNPSDSKDTVTKPVTQPSVTPPTVTVITNNNVQQPAQSTTPTPVNANASKPADIQADVLKRIRENETKTKQVVTNPSPSTTPTPVVVTTKPIEAKPEIKTKSTTVSVNNLESKIAEQPQKPEHSLIISTSPETTTTTITSNLNSITKPISYSNVVAQSVPKTAIPIARQPSSNNISNETSSKQTTPPSINSTTSSKSNEQKMSPPPPPPPPTAQPKVTPSDVKLVKPTAERN